MALDLIVRVQIQIKDRKTALRVYVKKFRLRIETGRAPVGGPVLIRFNQRAIELRLFLLVGNRLTLRIEAGRPIRSNKRRTDYILAGNSIEQEVVAVAAGLREQ